MSYDPPAKTTIDGKAPLQIHEQPTNNGRTCILQQEPARRLQNLLRLPVLLETAETSSYASYDDFTLRFLRQASVNVKHLKLADEGIHGNGHYNFLKKKKKEKQYGDHLDPRDPREVDRDHSKRSPGSFDLRLHKVRKP